MRATRLWGSALLAVILCLGASITRTRSLPRFDNRHARIIALYEYYRGNFPEVPEITVDELLATPTEAYTLVDVRTEDEQNVSMIPGSQTLEQFQQAASVNATLKCGGFNAEMHGSRERWRFVLNRSTEIIPRE